MRGSTPENWLEALGRRPEENYVCSWVDVPDGTCELLILV